MATQFITRTGRGRKSKIAEPESIPGEFVVYRRVNGAKYVLIERNRHLTGCCWRAVSGKPAPHRFATYCGAAEFAVEWAIAYQGSQPVWIERWVPDVQVQS